jgi:H+-transporting ATPase
LSTPELDEKRAPVSDQIEPNEKKPLSEEDEEEEDMDALIEELESQDGHLDEEDEDPTEPGGARPIPEELLNTNTRTGLNDQEVLARRKRFGINQMKEEKENLIVKFLGYFVGPIQFVMEVCFPVSLVAFLGQLTFGQMVLS